MHKKKSLGLKPGDFGGQEIGPPFPIEREGSL